MNIELDSMTTDLITNSLNLSIGMNESILQNTVFPKLIFSKLSA
jgi:hypothetical protein